MVPVGTTKYNCFMEHGEDMIDKHSEALRVEMRSESAFKYPYMQAEILSLPSDGSLGRGVVSER